MASSATKKSNNIASILLIILLLVGIITGRYLTVLCVLVVFGVRFLHSIFYTRIPPLYWAFMLSGIGLGAATLYYEQGEAVIVFVGLALLEALRVFLIALFNYPSTIKNLETLTSELELRVEQRTVELRDANSQLKEANDKLLELDKMKSSFVSQASHDLRTPLTAIKGSLDNLSLGIAGELNEKQVRILERAQRSVNRLTGLINDILDLNRIESGREKINKMKTGVNIILQNAVQEHKPAAEQKKIKLQSEIPKETLYIFADPQKIERIVGEMISNAIKYTPENGNALVTLKGANEMVEVSVKDTGVGMEPDECNKIWERFYRTANSQHMAKGSGLGLSIAKELVEMHGGSIRATSQPGQGSTFILTLPMYNKN
ncbi:MAG: HAMP domain-containing sensor histidine kinase [Candidatus Hinthialibacter antarcticus]|nr:HAMP domain-containing sensor histidine kinase [Candidatus Hinthialibacter antarcticus]